MTLEMPNFDPEKNFSKRILDVANRMREVGGKVDLTYENQAAVPTDSGFDKIIFNDDVNLSLLHYGDLPSILESNGTTIVSADLIYRHESNPEKTLRFNKLKIWGLKSENEKETLTKIIDKSPKISYSEVSFE